MLVSCPIQFFVVVVLKIFGNVGDAGIVHAHQPLDGERGCRLPGEKGIGVGTAESIFDKRGIISEVLDRLGHCTLGRQGN